MFAYATFVLLNRTVLTKETWINVYAYTIYMSRPEINCK